MPTTGMTRAFGGIVSDRTIDTRVRRALDRFSQPYLWVTNEAVYLDDQGRVAVRLDGTTLQQSASGLKANPAGVFTGLTLTGFTGFLYSANGTVSAVSNVCTLINTSATQTGNTAATETDLFSYTVPASTLAATGDCLELMASGTCATSASLDKRVRVKFGGTTILDTVNESNSGTGFDWTLRGTVIRTGATTQKCEAVWCFGVVGSTPVLIQNYTTASETLSGTVVLKLTGQGTLANDVVGEFWKVIKQPV